MTQNGATLLPVCPGVGPRPSPRMTRRGRARRPAPIGRRDAEARQPELVVALLLAGGPSASIAAAPVAYFARAPRGVACYAIFRSLAAVLSVRWGPETNLDMV